MRDYVYIYRKERGLVWRRFILYVTEAIGEVRFWKGFYVFSWAIQEPIDFIVVKLVWDFYICSLQACFSSAGYTISSLVDRS